MLYQPHPNIGGASFDALNSQLEKLSESIKLNQETQSQQLLMQQQNQDSMNIMIQILQRQQEGLDEMKKIISQN